MVSSVVLGRGTREQQPLAFVLQLTQPTKPTKFTGNCSSNNKQE